MIQSVKFANWCFLVKCSFIAVVIVVITACSSSSDGGNSQNADDNTNGSTSNLATLAALRNEIGVTKEYALAQFAAHFGELQSAPGYTADGSMPIFATHAVAEVLQFIDEYDEAVQAEVYAKLFPPVGSAVSTTCWQTRYPIGLDKGLAAP